ncbi:MAG: TROVE domain-containing protein [Geminicoccaceae bacterium]
MARLNTTEKITKVTHEGGRAFAHLKPEQQLRRSVLACMLWEKAFYEDGQSIADRIKETAVKCDPQFVADLAIETRSNMNLRHAPLMLTAVLSQINKGSSLVPDTIEAVIQRADELAEFLLIQAEVNGTEPRKFSHGVRKGIARAFNKFDEYQLAKYNRDGKVRLRDAMFLTHAKPSTDRNDLYKRLANNELVTPDTWEVGLSGGADKKETFERLLSEGKLGYMAVLRNLRKMNEVGVDHSLIKNAILERKGARRVLPFRYVAAARAAPMFEPVIDQALLASLKDSPVMGGKTIVLVDASSSMTQKLSAKSDMTRVDAAAALASVLIGQDVRVFLFASEDRHYTNDGQGKLFWEKPHRLGMAGVDQIKNDIGGGTRLGHAIEQVNAIGGDRLIVISDEQSQDDVPAPKFDQAFMINVATDENGVGYGSGWTAHMTGFSEAVLCYICEMERAQ